MATRKISTHPSKLNIVAYSTAIALACFSGSVATFGMMKLVPGAEIVVGTMGLLFEAGKLTSFAMLHSKAIPRILRFALAGVGLILMAANVAGVSGFLSNAYERSSIRDQANGHVAQANAYASADLIERQLAAAESNLSAGRGALIKARDDKGRIKAAQAVIASATTERDALIKQLAAAKSTKAQAEGEAINAGSEFAAIAFIAGATGASADTIAHAAILTISAIPDVLAVLLLIAAGYAAPKPVRRIVRRRKAPRRPRPSAPAPRALAPKIAGLKVAGLKVAA
jgi:hypothetical protein